MQRRFAVIERTDAQAIKKGWREEQADDKNSSAIDALSASL